MISGILGTKQTQTQMFTEDGSRIPVTVISAGPCWVTQISEDIGGVQLGFGTAKHLTKAITGHTTKAGISQKPRFFRTMASVAATGEQKELAVGDTVTVDQVFAPGDAIRVVGTSKGKGFASAIKRHLFQGGPRTHGQSDRERAPGSLGSGTTPGRVFKGKRMAGRMGGDRVTVEGLQVVSVDAATNTLTVKGLVPGSRGGLLIIEKTV